MTKLTDAAMAIKGFFFFFSIDLPTFCAFNSTSFLFSRVKGSAEKKEVLINKLNKLNLPDSFQLALNPKSLPLLIVLLTNSNEFVYS